MSDWFIKLQHSGDAKLRLFFFHYAGGGASIFRGWEKHFGKEIDVFAVQSPGRENRYSAKPIACLKTKVDQLREEIAPYLDVPCIFVGHSMGAMLAFELARLVQEDPRHRLAHVVLSAMRAPHLPRIKPIMAGMSHDEFINEIKQYSRTPHEILDNRDIMDTFMPMLRADFTLSESRAFDCSRKLAVPATLFCGVDDDAVPIEDAGAWSSLLAQRPEFVQFDGGHFFIHAEQAKFVAEVQAIAQRAMQRRPAPTQQPQHA
jgi:medium-chain acyl-[acyl-carrier-protein] hydrolase